MRAQTDLTLRTKYTEMPPKRSTDSRRDNFSAQVVRILAERSGGRCAICRAPTWGPNDSRFKSTNIGQAAHITAAAPGGPRYDENLSPQSRSSALNGIWLCGNCHNKIDKNVEEYPVKRLHEIKKKAENDARLALGVAPIEKDASHDQSPITVATSANAIMEIRKVKVIVEDLIKEKSQQKHPYDLLEQLKYINVHHDSYLPAVGSELIQFYWRLVTLDIDQHTWLQVVRLLDEITAVYLSSLTQSDVNTVCAIINHMTTKKRRSSKDEKDQYQSAISFLSRLGKQLEKRTDLSNTPKDSMKQLSENVKPKRYGGDETDAGSDYYGNEVHKFQAVEGDEPTDWEFISAICGLAELTDEERKIKEQHLEEQGFITYVI